MNSFLKFLPVFVLYISIFRFIYLEDGLALIMHVSLPVIMGLILASALNPMLVFIQNKLRIKNRYIGIIITFLIIFLIISFMFTIIAPNIARSIRQLMATSLPYYTKLINIFLILAMKIHL